MTAPAAAAGNPTPPAPLTVVPPPARQFEPPVTWLLGRQLVAGLKWIALYTGFKSKLDARDWMHPEVFAGPASGEAPAAPPSAPQWREEEGAFWFDYIADSGDGTRASYSIACLCLSDLWTAKAPDPARPEEPVAFAADDARLNGAAVKRLPRGQFLLAGGDTAYHLSDYWTLIGRFQRPFSWAQADLQASQPAARERRPIFGLPGNHDYYDFIDGFGRQFRRPTSPEGQKNALGLLPQLDLPGFRRCQNASYAAIALPHDWWLWTIDCENGRVDLRQQDFFRRLNNGTTPAKLIVATPEPSTYCGRKAKSQDKIPAVFRRLFPTTNGTRQPFLVNGELDAARCRLDLSGDHHKYERYWGTAGEPREAHANHDSPARQPQDGERANYASIVAGLGGAFLHPTETYVDQVPRQTVYPQPKRSRKAVADRIFNPAFIARDSFVRPLAAALAVLTCIGVLGRSEPIKGNELRALVASWPPRLDVVATFLACIAGLLALRTARRFINGRYRRSVGEDGRTRDARWVWIYAVAGVGLSISGLVAGLFGSHSSIEASVAIALSLAAAAIAASGASMYAEWVARQVRTDANAARYYYSVVGGLSALAVAAPMAAMFGARAQRAGDIMTDLIVALILIAVGGGAVMVAWMAGRELNGRPVAAGIAALGALHVLVQLGLPLLFVLMPPWHMLVEVGVALLALAAMARVGRACFRANRRFALLAAFVVLIVCVAALPVYDLMQAFAAADGPRFMRDPLAVGILRMVLAGVVAALVAPVWLGWYFAVALTFNAHNNEVAGAVRIEEFKQMIRFRVTDKSITGYVIAIDAPQESWQKLRPRLVDVFTLQAT